MKTFLILLMFCFSSSTFAQDSTAGKKIDQAGGALKEGAQDAAKNTKEVYRDAKDKSCHLVKGKMECAGDKIKHKIQNGVDEVSDKANDVKKN